MKHENNRFAKATAKALAVLSKWKSMGNTVVQRDVQELSQPSEKVPIWILWGNLSGLGCCVGDLALLRIDEGDVYGGWTQCQLAYLYTYWGFGLEFVDYPRLRKLQGPKWNLDLSANSASCALLHAILLGRTEKAGAVYRHLVDALRRGWFKEQYLRNNPLTYFALNCFARLNSLNETFEPKPSIDCYVRAFENWEDPSFVAETISSMCEFRLGLLEGVEEFYGFETQEIRSSYQLFWVDLLVLRKMLLEKGISVDNSIHPYFQSVWANPILEQPEPDALLKRLMPRMIEISQSETV